MEKTGTPSPLRVEEPFIKAHLALWLAARGASVIRILVDGAESHPDQLRQILVSAGYSHQVAPKSRVVWTGTYTRDQTQILIASRPGLDVSASLPSGEMFVAECKGQPTPIAVKSGADLTSLYNALGQLVRHVGEMAAQPQERALVLADTHRMRGIAQDISRNPAVRTLEVFVLLVDSSGKVHAL